MDLGHLKKTVKVFRYASPPGRHHARRPVPEGCEEIEVIVRGRARFDAESRPLAVEPGSMIWYQPDESVGEVVADAADPYETVVFLFEVIRPSASPMPRHARWLDAGECGRFCRDALSLFHAGTEEDRYFLPYHYARLAWEARRWMARAPGNELPRPVRKAQRFLQDRLARPVEMEELAEAAGVSASHLHLLFRRHVGTPPMRYALQLRIRRARDLLASSDLSIKEICFAVGFRNAVHFGRTFRRLAGLSPSGYRNQYRYPLAEGGPDPEMAQRK